ncbi:uncharacterized protein TM35_000123050 [Trypanosoma theileri]|uniref:Uncharacterized protein n=1 Tax=Trypanosoma theileri TaxID=67003 RepID=A0A1X0NZF5_9TRYP|nr:uncharacterized protein TM35_000123050 [Trypanosoma theileri]ORC89530.1 hypothetical protein TM35_000123050 [Trypanosoma theileri]
MTLCCRLLLRAYASEGNRTTAALATATTTSTTTTTTHSNSNSNSNNNTTTTSSSTVSAAPQKSSSQQPYRSSLLDTPTSNEKEMDALRKELAAAQLRISELRLSQIKLHEALLRRLDETDRAAHKTATELRYTALALQCHHDLLETELRRILAIKPQSTNSNSNNNNGNSGGGAAMSKEDIRRLRAAAIEAASREMVRKNIGFRVERVSEEPAPSQRVSGSTNNNSDNMTKNNV